MATVPALKTIDDILAFNVKRLLLALRALARTGEANLLTLLTERHSGEAFLKRLSGYENEPDSSEDK